MRRTITLLLIFLLSISAASALYGKSDYFVGSVNTAYLYMVGKQLNFNETKLNSTITSKTYWNYSGGNLYPSNLSANVGIGTPTPNEPLHVYMATGNLDARFQTGSSDNIRVYYETGGNDWENRVGSVYSIIQTNNGNAQPFTIQASAPTSAVDIGMGYMRINGNNNDYDFIVDTDNEEASLFVEGSSGNIGIGTSTTSAKLDVNGTVLINGSGSSTSFYLNLFGSGPNILTFTAENISNVPNTMPNNAFGAFQLENDKYGGTTLWGHSEDYIVPLSLRGQFNNESVSLTIPAVNIEGFKYDSSNGHVKRMADNETVLTINSGHDVEVIVKGNGNMGIGTITPNTTLTVNGTVRAENVVIGRDNSLTAVGMDILNGQYLISYSGVPHGITDVINPNGAGYFGIANNNQGGIDMIGVSRGATSGLLMSGILGSADPSDSIAAVKIRAYKNISGSSGAINDSETILQIQNAESTIAMTVLGGGNVGIGTSTPGAKLEVNGNMSVNKTLYVLENGNVGIGTSTPVSQLTLLGGAPIVSMIDTGGGVYWQFGGLGSVFRINEIDGNGAIKTTNGLGTVMSIFSNLGGEGSVISFNTANNKDLNFQFGGTINDNMFFMDAGTQMVGIGTSTPNAKLEVNGIANITSGMNINTGLNDVDTHIYTKFSSFFNIDAGLNRVGIGTTTPQAKVEISGTNPTVMMSDAGNGGWWQFGSRTGNFRILEVNSSGSIVNQYLQIGVGGADVIWNYNNEDLSLAIRGLTDDYLFYTNATSDEVYMALGSGNVGIGTNTPTEKLNVVGGINWTGQLINNNVTGLTANITTGNCWQSYQNGIIYATNCSGA